jgi:hypothetical protein
VAVYDIDDDAMYAADEEINELLGKVASCRASDRWPGAQEEPGPLRLPAWVVGSDEDDELTSEVINQGER